MPTNSYTGPRLNVYFEYTPYWKTVEARVSRVYWRDTLWYTMTTIGCSKFHFTFVLN